MADHLGRSGRFSRRALLSAAGAALISADLAATAGAGVLVDHRFDRMRDRNGWGRGWYARHYSLVFDVHKGRGRLHLPAGLESTAPSQPIPVFLLDHECRDATQELHFQVTHAGLRPGLVLHRRDAFHYLAVTVEDRRLVLASYGRTERHVLAHARVVALDTDHPHVLRVAVSGRTLRAGLWREGHPPRMQLAARLPTVAAGTPGVLLVAPADRKPGSLLVSRHILSARRFRTTTPQAALLVTGTPQAKRRRDHRQSESRLRCPRLDPVRVVVRPVVQRRGETVGGAQAGATVLGPRADRAGRRPSRLLARTIHRNRQPHGGPLTHAAVHATARLRPARDGGSLVRSALAAAGLQGARAGCSTWHLPQPAILVYQGDLGYAGNSRFSSYHRGTRLLLRALHKDAQRPPLRDGAPSRTGRFHRR